MQTAERPRLAAPRLAEAPQSGAVMPMPFDPDAYHAMDKRDDALIQDELLNGPTSRAFVYSFNVQGKPVAGISVVGARHLASEYGGIQHRLVASVEKRGGLFTFTSYPSQGIEMRVTCAVVEELQNEPDFYRAVVEVRDIKTGNTIQVERQELRFEKRTNGSTFERPNYATIAQSKAFRNGVLSLIPQDVQIGWKLKMLQLPESQGAVAQITQSVLDEKRSAVLRFAASKAIPFDRHQVENLTLDQITGLGDAARDGNSAGFAQAAQALGLIEGVDRDGVVQDAGQTKSTDPAGAVASTGTVAAETTTASTGTVSAAAGKQAEEKPQQSRANAPQPEFDV